MSRIKIITPSSGLAFEISDVNIEVCSNISFANLNNHAGVMTLTIPYSDVCKTYFNAWIEQIRNCNTSSLERIGWKRLIEIIQGDNITDESQFHECMPTDFSIIVSPSDFRTELKIKLSYEYETEPERQNIISICNSNSLVTRQYVAESLAPPVTDDRTHYTYVRYNPSEVVHTTGNETISGERHFDIPVVTNNNLVLSMDDNRNIGWVNSDIRQWLVEPISNITQSFKNMLNDIVEELE